MLHRSAQLPPTFALPEVRYCRRCRGPLAAVQSDLGLLRCTSCGTIRTPPRQYPPELAASEVGRLLTAEQPAGAQRGVGRVQRVTRAAVAHATALYLAFSALPIRTRISTAAVGIAVCLAGIVAVAVR